MGQCVYEAQKNYFPVLVENMTLSFSHSFSTNEEGLQGSMPTTYIYRSGANMDEDGVKRVPKSEEGGLGWKGCWMC